ncbi:heme transporter HRG1-like isoform X2 [Antedon mediterranea]
MERSASSLSRIRLRIGYAVTGTSLGLLVLIVFLADEKFRNYHVACWGGFSSLFAMVCLFLHLQHNKDNSKERYIPVLSILLIIGLVTQMGCIVAFFTYIVMAVEQKQDLTTLNCNPCGYYLASIWVFMSWKWSFLTFLYARMYRNIYTVRYGEIID